MAKKNELGIEKIKASFKGLLSLVNPIIDAIADDGKIAITELFSIAPRLIVIPQLTEDVKASLNEFKNLTAAEAKEVSDYFKKEFDIPNDALEAHIEEGLDLLVEGYETVTSTIKWYGRAHKWVDDFKTLKAA